MRLSPFLLDHWLNQKYEYSIEYDLASSTGPVWTLRELLQLVDQDHQKFLMDAQLEYSDAAGIRRLREAIADFSGVHVEDVQVLTGGSEGLLILFFLAAEPGANVVLPFPSFPPFAEIAKSFGVETRFYHLRPENQFRISTDEIRSISDSNTKIIILNSPHNPTGAVVSNDELTALHDFSVNRNILLVVDEVYHPLYSNGMPRVSAARLPHAVVLSDLSKALCFSGLRIGWIIDRNPHRLEQYLNARSYFTISNSPLTEILATFVLENSEKILRKANEVTSRNLALLDSFFAENQEYVRWVRPQGGTISFPWLVSGNDSRPLCEAMREQGVFLAPGDAFGMPSHFRLGYGASSKDLRPALQKMENYFRNPAVR
jgi:aspartate/methionine/tyrosine aminotransferase